MIEKEEDEILARDRATSLIFYWQNDYLLTPAVFKKILQNPEICAFALLVNRHRTAT